MPQAAPIPAHSPAPTDPPQARLVWHRDDGRGILFVNGKSGGTTAPEFRKRSDGELLVELHVEDPELRRELLHDILQQGDWMPY